MAHPATLARPEAGREEYAAMKTRITADPVRYSRMNTEALRAAFLIDDLYRPGDIGMAYVDQDRAVVGIAAPLTGELALPTYPQLRAENFTDRRELGVLNIGGPGVVRVGGTSFELNALDLLYIGRENPVVRFESAEQAAPAVFYLLSYPAHAKHPNTLVRKEDAHKITIGSGKTANRRTVSKYVHAEGARSCQLVMGVTQLEEGSVWNTMPPHTHMRRSEIYFYFDLSDDARVFHFMGPPDETRNLVIRNREAVVSPGWSIHAGAGTEAYKFCWGMGGENQDYADMDPAPLAALC